MSHCNSSYKITYRPTFTLLYVYRNRKSLCILYCNLKKHIFRLFLRLMEYPEKGHLFVNQQYHKLWRTTHDPAIYQPCSLYDGTCLIFSSVYFLRKDTFVIISKWLLYTIFTVSNK